MSWNDSEDTSGEPGERSLCTKGAFTIVKYYLFIFQFHVSRGERCGILRQWKTAALEDIILRRPLYFQTHGAGARPNKDFDLAKAEIFTNSQGLCIFI